MEVPSILLSGNHKEINDWRYREMIKRTLERRKDLILSKNSKNTSLNKIMNMKITPIGNYIWIFLIKNYSCVII